MYNIEGKRGEDKSKVASSSNNKNIHNNLQDTYNTNYYNINNKRISKIDQECNLQLPPSTGILGTGEESLVDNMDESIFNSSFLSSLNNDSVDSIFYNDSNKKHINDENNTDSHYQSSMTSSPVQYYSSLNSPTFINNDNQDQNQMSSPYYSPVEYIDDGDDIKEEEEEEEEKLEEEEKEVNSSTTSSSSSTHGSTSRSPLYRHQSNSRWYPSQATYELYSSLLPPKNPAEQTTDDEDVEKEEEEEEEEEEDDSTYYQRCKANIPDYFGPYTNENESEHEPTLIYDGTRLSQEKIDDYLQCARKLFTRHDKEIAEIGINLNMNIDRISDDQLLKILHEYNYSPVLALDSIDYSTIQSTRPCLEDYIKLTWTPKEILKFYKAFVAMGRAGLPKIHTIIGTKSRMQVIEYYYYWKNTSQYKRLKRRERSEKSNQSYQQPTRLKETPKIIQETQDNQNENNEIQEINKKEIDQENDNDKEIEKNEELEINDDNEINDDYDKDEKEEETIEKYDVIEIEDQEEKGEKEQEEMDMKIYVDHDNDDDINDKKQKVKKKRKRKKERKSERKKERENGIKEQNNNTNNDDNNDEDDNFENEPSIITKTKTKTKTKNKEKEEKVENEDKIEEKELNRPFSSIDNCMIIIKDFNEEEIKRKCLEMDKAEKRLKRQQQSRIYK